jgi:hypothetical protein
MSDTDHTNTQLVTAPRIMLHSAVLALTSCLLLVLFTPLVGAHNLSRELLRANSHGLALTAESVDQSYSLATSSGGLIGIDGALDAPGPGVLARPAVGMASTPDDSGAWVVAGDGGVFTYGDARFFGSTGAIHLNRPVVGIAPTTDGGGYWLVASDGGVFSFGDAHFQGSMGGTPLNQPVVGMATDPSTNGYWLVAADGGIFSFDAPFYGSTGNLRLNKPVVAMAVTPDGHGYWLVASDGGVFTFGDAQFYGSTGGIRLNRPVVGMTPTSDGHGYWLVASDGGIFTFGDAAYYGSAANMGQSVVGMGLEVGGYANPLRSVAGLTPQRVDQGVDYAGGGPIYAIGDGVVLNTTNAGWPGGAFISYRLEDGRAAGDVVYVAENVIPQVSVGQQVTPNTVVGTLIDAYPDLETGWAAPPGTGESAAMAAGQWSPSDDSDSVPSAYGANFSQLLQSLGAPGGLLLGPVSGSVAVGWPVWLQG